MLRLSQIIILILLGGLIAGCATSAKNVQAAYISPVTYEKYSCRQIEKEALRLSERASVLAQVQNKKAENDGVAVAAGIILSPLALFLIDGDDANTAELAQIKGKYKALKSESEKKGCDIPFPEPKAKEKKKKKKDDDF